MWKKASLETGAKLLWLRNALRSAAGAEQRDHGVLGALPSDDARVPGVRSWADKSWAS